MTVEKGIFDHPTTHPGLAALIGTRLHPDYFSEDEELPAIAYSLEDDRSMPTQQGPSALRQATYRFDIWANTAAETVAVIKQMCAALDGYRGSFKETLSIGNAPVAMAAIRAYRHYNRPVATPVAESMASISLLGAGESARLPDSASRKR